MSEWLDCYRIAHPSHRLRAKKTKGGEPYGDPVMGMVAPPGHWLCENVENGHRWVCSPEAFKDLYCEVGKSPPKKKKKQENGHRKGKSRKRSASNESVSDSVWGKDTLFDGVQEES